MWPYWVPFIILAFTSTLKKQILDNYFSIFIFVLSLLFVGLRYEVGVDWFNYLSHITDHSDFPLFSEISERFSEPVYAFVLWFSLKANYDLVGINFINSSCAS